MATSTSTIEAPEEKVQTVDEIAAELEAEESAKSNPPSEDGDDELILGKFKSREDLEKAYQELEKKQSKGKAEEPAEVDEEGKEGGLGITQKEAEAAADEAGLDFAELTSKYREKGELEDSDYEALDKIGLPRETVDMFVKGQEALATQYENAVLESFGDRSAYDEMTQWASDNLSEAQIETFNDAVNSGNVEKAQFAISALKAQYEKVNGTEPSARVGAQPSTGGARFESEAEWTKAMEDPRYWNDESYRSKVERKFANTWGG